MNIGFLKLAPSNRISIDELVARDNGAGPFVWVRLSDISGIDVPSILARNLASRENPVLSLDEEDSLVQLDITRNELPI